MVVLIMFGLFNYRVKAISDRFIVESLLLRKYDFLCLLEFFN